MTKIKLTNKEALNFANELDAINADPNTKLGFAKARSLRFIKDTFVPEYNDQIDALRAKNAATETIGGKNVFIKEVTKDGKGNDVTNYRFDEAGLAKFKTDVKTYNSETIELKIYPFTPVDPVDLAGVTPEVADYLTEVGFIINASAPGLFGGVAV